MARQTEFWEPAENYQLVPILDFFFGNQLNFDDLMTDYDRLQTHGQDQLQLLYIFFWLSHVNLLWYFNTSKFSKLPKIWYYYYQFHFF